MSVPSQFIYSDPDVPVQEFMEFHLVYAGNDLKAASASDTRSKEKQRLRIHFHSQLKYLWETHPVLRRYAEGKEKFDHKKEVVFEFPHHRDPDSFTPSYLAKQFQGYVPLIMHQFGMLCELDILFLRPEPPGGIITTGSWGGDLDNRIKTLLDGLRAPARGETVPKVGDVLAPDPLYVLLEDDCLVSSIRVSADRLLDPGATSRSASSLVITVTTKIINPLLLPYGIQP